MNVSLVWIKAHVGHPGNERADFLAKTGTELDVSDSVWVKVPGNSFRRRAASEMASLWAREWQQYAGGRMAKQFFPQPNAELSDRLISLDRQDLTKIVTMTSGHNDLRYYYHLRNPEIDPESRLCTEENETFYHLYTRCPR